MNAEKRNRRYELYFHFLLAFYSISSIGCSIIAAGHKAVLGDDVFLFLSVCTLALSLLIFGFKFGETAAQHRACYLLLQTLRFEDHTANSLNSKYITTIGSLPNHTSHDFYNLVIDDLFSKSQREKNAYQEPYEFSWFKRSLFALHHLMIWTAAILLFFPAVYILIKALSPAWFGI